MSIAEFRPFYKPNSTPGDKPSCVEDMIPGAKQKGEQAIITESVLAEVQKLVGDGRTHSHRGKLTTRNADLRP